MDEKIIELFVFFSLGILSIAVSLMSFLIAFFKNFKLSDYLKKTDKELYNDVTGVIYYKNREIGYNNFRYWMWVLRNVKGENRKIRSMKMTIRPFIKLTLACMAFFILDLLYMIIRFPSY